MDFLDNSRKPYFNLSDINIRVSSAVPKNTMYLISGKWGTPDFDAVKITGVDFEPPEKTRWHYLEFVDG